MIYYYSQSTLAGGCHKKINLIQNGWKRKLVSNDVAFGQACHFYIAQREQGVDELDASIKTLELFVKTPMYTRIKYLTSDVLKMFFSRWETRDKKHEFAKLEDGKVACEYSICYPLSENTFATGTLDGFVLCHDGFAIYDIKTTCKKDPDLEEYEMSSQFLHYAAILKAFASKNPDAWITKNIINNLTTIIVASVQIAYNGKINIEHYPFKINWERVAFYWYEFLEFVNNTKGSTQETGLITGQCMSGKDYVCDFLPLCLKNDTLDLTQEPYDPIGRHKESKI